MLKKIISLVLAMLVFVSALSISAFADFDKPTGSCPLCGSPLGYVDIGAGGIAGYSYVRCTNKNCAFWKTHGLLGFDVNVGISGGLNQSTGTRSNTATVPKNYYTTNNNSSTTNYNTVNSGSTNHYSTINTTNRTLNYTTYNQTTNNYVRNTYNYTNYTYNYDYNYYTVNVDNSTHYVIDNVNYITVLYPTGETVKDENGNDVPEYDYTDVYYELPDGRNSYDLSASDIWGTYFLYDVKNFNEIPEDDGTTLALFHFDGDYKNSAAFPSSLSASSTVLSFDTGKFDGALVQTCQTAAYRSLVLSGISVLNSFKTVEFWVYFSSLYARYANSTSTEVFSQVCPAMFSYKISVPTGCWIHVALCRNNTGGYISDGTGWHGPFSVFINGIKSSVTLDNFEHLGNIVVPQLGNGSNDRRWSTVFGFDELRFSNEVLYTDTFVPSSQPFDTNSVLVLPSDPSDKDIAIMSNIPVNDYRIGGVRPTYPAKGDVYIYLENDVVESVQQYQGDGWASVDAQIYTDGAWKNLKKFNLATVKSEEVETKPGPTATPGPSTPTPTPGGSTGCTHQYTVTKEKAATCTESGYKIYKCDLCGDTYTDSIKALGHDWQIVPLESALLSGETSDASPSPESSAAPDASPPPAESGSETTDPTPAPTYTLYRCSRCNMEYKDFDGSGPPKDKDDEEGGLWGWIKKLFSSVWNGILDILETVVGGTIDLVCKLIDDLVAGVNHVITGLFNALGQISDFGGGFKDFLGAFFSFVPPEIITLLAFSISLGIILMIIKFFRG